MSEGVKYIKDVIVLVRSFALKHRMIKYLKQYSEQYYLDTNDNRLYLTITKNPSLNWRHLPKTDYTYIYNIKSHFYSKVCELHPNYLK